MAGLRPLVCPQINIQIKMGLGDVTLRRRDAV